MSQALTKPPSRGAQTREKLLDIAEAAVLEKGFGATSIDEVIVEAGLTKSGFFYHFKDKNDLALALLDRYVVRDTAIFDELFRRADELSDDPLHAYLIALKLTAELFGDLPNGHPGCLVATVTFHERQFNAEVRRRAAEGTLLWRDRFHARLKRVAEAYPPKVDVDLETLADMFNCLVDGAIIMAKGLSDPQILVRQVMAYRAFVRTVFIGA